MDPFPLMFNLESGIYIYIYIYWFCETQQLRASLIRSGQLCINHVGRYMFSIEPDLLG